MIDTPFPFLVGAVTHICVLLLSRSVIPLNLPRTTPLSDFRLTPKYLSFPALKSISSIPPHLAEPWELFIFFLFFKKIYKTKIIRFIIKRKIMADAFACFT